MAGVANSSFVHGVMSPLRFLRNAADGETTPGTIPESELIRMDRLPVNYGEPQPLVDAYRTRLWIACAGAFSLWAGFDIPNDPGGPGRRWFKFHDAAPANGQTLTLVEPVPAGCVITVLSSAAGPVYFSQTM